MRALRAESKARKTHALERKVVYCRCPACDSQMLRRTFGETSYLLVHYCATHGFWIHRDELEAIASFVARGGEILEMAHATEQLAERVRRLENQTRSLEQRSDGGGVAFVPFPF